MTFLSNSKIEQAYILCLVVFLLYACHYLQINSSGLGLLLPFNAMAWIPLSFAIAACLLFIAKNQQFYFSPLTIRLLVCLLLLCIPFLYFNALFAQIIDRFLGLIAGFILFVSFQQFLREKKQLMVVLLLLIVAVWIVHCADMVHGRLAHRRILKKTFRI